jgi:uncharacterized protein YjhX (UPF0386 family)
MKSKPTAAPTGQENIAQGNALATAATTPHPSPATPGEATEHHGEMAELQSAIAEAECYKREFGWKWPDCTQHQTHERLLFAAKQLLQIQQCSGTGLDHLTASLQMLTRSEKAETRVKALEESLRLKTAEAESWESTAKLVSKLPCGHPNDCGYDKNNDGRWANIGCIWCERDQLKAAFRELAEAAQKAQIQINKCRRFLPPHVSFGEDGIAEYESAQIDLNIAISSPIVQSAIKK